MLKDKFICKPFFVLFILLALIMGCATNKEGVYESYQKSGKIEYYNSTEIRQRHVDSLNALRLEKGLKEVAISHSLNSSAATHARDIYIQQRAWNFGSDGSSPQERAEVAGFIGVVIGALYFAIKNKKPLLAMGDVVALSTPPGLFLGRVANFINQELWGRPTTSVLGIEFSQPPASICPEKWPYDLCLRHPSQLYEASLEGLILTFLLLLLVFFFNALKSPGRIMGVFFLTYGIARIFVEFFREADFQYVSTENPFGYVIFLPWNTGLSMGQSLSLPMVLAGLFFLLYSFKKS